MRHLIDLIESAGEIVWHGSVDKFDITQAKPMTHFGSKKAAAHRIHTKRAELTMGAPRSITTGYLYPVRLNIQNPLKIVDRAGLTHHSYKLTDMLHYTLKKITREERSEIMAENCDFAKIAEVLIRKGYDGLYYPNAVEDPGHISYVVFDGSQIVPAGPPEMYVQHGAFNGKLLESAFIPSPADLALAIRDKVTEYANNGTAPNAYEINNGSCEDFAEEVVRDLAGEETEQFWTTWADNLSKVDGDGFAASEEWDQDLIAKLFPNCQPTHGLTWEQADQAGIPAHCWIVLNNRHYDAECPDGVDNFFELPLIRRGMEHLSQKLGAVTEAFSGGFQVNSVYGPQTVEVYHNPSRKEFDAIWAAHKAVRGFIGDDVYVWDAHLADHGMVGNELGLGGLHAEWRADGLLVINWNNSWNGAYGYDDFDHVKRSIEESPLMKRLLIGFEVVRS